MSWSFVPPNCGNTPKFILNRGEDPHLATTFDLLSLTFNLAFITRMVTDDLCCNVGYLHKRKVRNLYLKYIYCIALTFLVIINPKNSNYKKNLLSVLFKEGRDPSPQPTFYIMLVQRISAIFVALA
jgi:hypothetical protein